MKPRFPIGLAFQRKRFPKAKELTEYTIEDVYMTYNSSGEVVKLEYLVSHEFMGQPIKEMMVDPTIARCLAPEVFDKYK